MTTPDLERLFAGVAALPTSFIVDRDGRIVQKHVGMLNATTIEAETRVLAGIVRRRRVGGKTPGLEALHDALRGRPVRVFRLELPPC